MEISRQISTGQIANNEHVSTKAERTYSKRQERKARIVHVGDGTRAESPIVVSPVGGAPSVVIRLPLKEILAYRAAGETSIEKPSTVITLPSASEPSSSSTPVQVVAAKIAEAGLLTKVDYLWIEEQLIKKVVSDSTERQKMCLDLGYWYLNTTIKSKNYWPHLQLAAYWFSRVAGERNGLYQREGKEALTLLKHPDLSIHGGPRFTWSALANHYFNRYLRDKELIYYLEFALSICLSDCKITPSTLPDQESLTHLKRTNSCFLSFIHFYKQEERAVRSYLRKLGFSFSKIELELFLKGTSPKETPLPEEPPLKKVKVYLASLP